MDRNRSRGSDGSRDMGIPLAGGEARNTGRPGVEGAEDGDVRTDSLDFEVAVGHVAEGLRPVSQSPYRSSETTGLSLLVENTGTRTFERVEVRIRADDGDTVGELVATGESELDGLAPGDRWRLWIPLGDGPGAATRYTIDLGAT